MAIPVASLAGTLYEIPSSLNPPTVHTLPPAVFAYDGTAARVTVTTSPTTAGRTHLTLALNPAGDTIFLPFQADQVHSVYIDMAAIAAAGHGPVTGFLTPESLWMPYLHRQRGGDKQSGHLPHERSGDWPLYQAWSGRPFEPS